MMNTKIIIGFLFCFALFLRGKSQDYVFLRIFLKDSSKAEFPVYVGYNKNIAQYFASYLDTAKYNLCIVGKVDLVMTIDTVGKIDTAFIKSGVGKGRVDQIFYNAMMATSGKWKASTLNGKKVPQTILIRWIVNLTSTVKFVLIDGTETTDYCGQNQYYYNQGLDYFNKGLYKDAIKSFDKALKYNPGDIDSYYNRAVAKYKLQDTEGACADFKLAAFYGDPDAPKMIAKYCK